MTSKRRSATGISSGTLPVIAIDRRDVLPLHRQLYEGFRTAILSGNLRPGHQVPSTRMLAMELGISRFPVTDAYAQLLAEGYFESRAGSGTFVSSSLSMQRNSTKDNGSRSASAREVSQRSCLSPGMRIVRGVMVGEHLASINQHSTDFRSRRGQDWWRATAGNGDRKSSMTQSARFGKIPGGDLQLSSNITCGSVRAKSNYDRFRLTAGTRNYCARTPRPWRCSVDRRACLSTHTFGPPGCRVPPEPHPGGWRRHRRHCRR